MHMYKVVFACKKILICFDSVNGSDVRCYQEMTWRAACQLILRHFRAMAQFDYIFDYCPFCEVCHSL